MKNLLKLSLAVFIIILIVGCSNNNDSQNNAAKENDNDNNTTENEATSDSKFPEKPIEIIVPFAPGGSADIVARIMADGITKYLPNNASVAVINKEGSGGTVGMTELFQSDADGYTLAFAPHSTLTIQPHHGNTIYDYDDFDPILRVIDNPNLFVVSSKSDYETFDDWVDYVKANPNDFVFSVGTPGGEHHLMLQTLIKLVDAEAKIVPANGDAEVASNILGGHTDGAIVMKNIAEPYVESDDMRVLLNLSDQEIEGLESVPNSEDKDIALDSGGISLSFFAPKGLPEDVFEILSDAFQKALDDEDILEQIENTGSVVSYASSEEMKEAIKGTYEAYGSVIDEIE